MTEYLRVTGNDSLVRDTTTGAIINCNQEEYESYKKKLNNTLQMKKKLQEQESQITQLKTDIAEIKDLLYQILSAK